MFFLRLFEYQVIYIFKMAGNLENDPTLGVHGCSDVRISDPKVESRTYY
jgi:hypothetical protein